MKKQIEDYIMKIQEILKNDKKDIDYDEVLQEYKMKIGFYQHERLIHFLVLMTSILILFMSIAIYFISYCKEMLIVMILVLILIFPYILYYYFLENSVQKLYLIYDEIINKKGEVK